jgi:hypothetical protein
MAVRARWEAQAQRAKQLQGDSAAELVPGQDSPQAAAQAPGSAKVEPCGPRPGPESPARAPDDACRAGPAPVQQRSPADAAAVKQSDEGHPAQQAGPSAVDDQQRGPQPQVLQSGQSNMPAWRAAGYKGGAEPDSTEQPAMAEQHPIRKLGSAVGQHGSNAALMDSA